MAETGGIRTDLRLATAVAGRDLRVAVRSGGGWFNAVFFFAVFSGVTAFAVGPERADLAAVAPGLLWLGAALSLQLSAADLFARDLDDGSLRAYCAEQFRLGPYVAGKLAVLALSSAAPIAALSPLYLILFATDPAAAIQGMIVFVAGAPALCLAACAAAALTASAQGGGVLSASLAAPATIPVLIFGVAAVENVVAATGAFSFGADGGTALLLLMALELAYLVILPPVAVVALRIGLQ